MFVQVVIHSSYVGFVVNNISRLLWVTLLILLSYPGRIVEGQQEESSGVVLGTFEILRDPSSCQWVSVRTDGESAEDPTCTVIDVSHIDQMTAYTTFQKESMIIEARIGPLFAVNPDERLTYKCPPGNYNGFDYRFSYCEVVNNHTLLSVAYVTSDEEGNSRLLGIDTILSGKPFPEQPQVNQPPFGAARWKFLTTDGISLANGSSFLSICLEDRDDEAPSCTGVQNEQTLELQGLVYSGRGSFTLPGMDYRGPSVWIHDDERQLLHLTSGEANGFWFNHSGFFLVDYMAQTCNWFAFCNFACEVYNYDSRFLDFIGIWNITSKYGITTTTEETNTTNTNGGILEQVRVYLGNAIDAAGVFPCLMYISVETGYYVGLDKLDTTLGTGGSSFWYSETIPGTPDYANYPLPVDMGCPGTTEEWLTPIMTADDDLGVVEIVIVEKEDEDTTHSGVDQEDTTDSSADKEDTIDSSVDTEKDTATDTAEEDTKDKSDTSPSEARACASLNSGMTLIVGLVTLFFWHW